IDTKRLVSPFSNSSRKRSDCAEVRQVADVRRTAASMVQVDVISLDIGLRNAYDHFKNSTSETVANTPELLLTHHFIQSLSIDTKRLVSPFSNSSRKRSDCAEVRQVADVRRTAASMVQVDVISLDIGLRNAYDHFKNSTSETVANTPELLLTHHFIQSLSVITQFCLTDNELDQ
ncbi:hypothetical protein AHF37_04290, partial [Paragonimus kellicotti]